MSAGDLMPDTFTVLLGEDHRRLDARLAESKRRLATGDIARAALEFAEFRAGLERHIAAEEEILFPAFESRTGSARRGPTALLRAEHAELKRLMAEVTAALGGASHGSRTTPIAALTARIYAHNGKEERTLYPMASRAFALETQRERI